MGWLDGKRIVITGSTRGLGRAFATACAGEGARVVVNGTNSALVDEVAAETGGIGIAGSVADYDTCERVIAACVDSYGGIDVLVNNAGITRDRTMAKMTAEEFDDVVAVNLRGSWTCTKFAAAAMKDSGGGHIIQVLSNTGFTGNVGQSNYGAAKAGMAGLLRTWVLELARSGIRCNGIWPLAATDMTQVVIDLRRKAAREAGQPEPEPWQIGFGDPDEVAALVVYLASDAASHLNGQVISSNGRRIALWTHPQEIDITTRETPFSVDQLVEHFGPEAGRPLQSLYRAVLT